MGDLLFFKSKTDLAFEANLEVVKEAMSLLKHLNSAENAKYPVQVVLMDRDGFINLLSADRNFPKRWKIARMPKLEISGLSEGSVISDKCETKVREFLFDRILKPDCWLYCEV